MTNKKNINYMKRIFLYAVVLAIAIVLTQKAYAQDKPNKSHLIGLVGGVAFTSNPPALQKLTDKSHYVDGNGGLTYLFHNQVSDGYAFEWQMSFIGSSTSTLDHADNETKVKFIVPLDFRWFLGSQTISGYFGFGLQYNTVWLFTSGEDSENTYYDPWWGVYYSETTPGEDTWDWTVNQLSTNLATGFKVGFGKQKQHNIILGAKIHFPIINSSEHHGDETSSVDLSKDKVNVALTGGFSLGFNKQSGAFKVDIEYPLGGSNRYAINDGGHSTFFNTHSWSLSATLLLTVGH